MFDGPGTRLVKAPQAKAPQAKARTARWARLAPFLLVGPVSGPLLAGVVFNFREGRPVLGSLYAVALALFAVDLPMLAARALPGVVG